MAPRKPKASESESTEVAITPIEKREIILEGDPEAQLEFAQRASKALMNVVNQKQKPVVISNKTYLEYGDWQVLGRFYGATVEVEWTRVLKDDDGKTLKFGDKNMGYEARVLVKRNGEVISSAEGMCTRDETNKWGKPSIWATSPDFAVRSMAQTRTAAKALRNAFGWVAELAGYASTPAEEMDTMIPHESAPVVQKRIVVPSKTVPSPKQKIAYLLEQLGHPITELTPARATELTQKYAGLSLADENLEEIVTRLEVVLGERKSGQAELEKEFDTPPEEEQIIY